jgi:hypothetical protein
MPPPPELWIEGVASRLHGQEIYTTETPIAVWQTHRIDQAMWNCISRYHGELNDALTKAAPSVRADAMYHTSEARAMCSVFALNKIMPELVPASAKMIAMWLEEMGMDSSIMSDEDARAMAMDGNPSPKVLGSVVAADILDSMKMDGYNHNGAKNNHGDCSFNCQRFSDTTNYKPKNSPWDVTDAKAWQPLTEHDSTGFFYVQEHVTPHIGFTGKPWVLSREEIDARTLSDPAYDYEAETQTVIDTVASLTDTQKATIEFMDNKINIAGGMIMRLRAKYAMSFEAQVFYHYGYTSAEMDTVILAWKEKINHDLIRTTTTVQAKGSEQITAFDGTTINAYDWTPYMRVMPHSEYPSGSGCICTGVHQYVDAFTMGAFGDSSIATEWTIDAMSSNVEYGVPANDVVMSFANMGELRDMCGQSRLWGGMHFGASVPDSYELCDGVGTKAYSDLMVSLLGTAKFSDFMNEELVELYEPPVDKGGGKGKGKKSLRA